MMTFVQRKNHPNQVKRQQNACFIKVKERERGRKRELYVTPSKKEITNYGNKSITNEIA